MRGQTSFELLLFTAFLFVVILLVVSPFLQIMDETRAISITKSSALELVSRQGQKYVVYEIKSIPSEQKFVVVLRPVKGTLFDDAGFVEDTQQKISASTGYKNAVVVLEFEQEG